MPNSKAFRMKSVVKSNKIFIALIILTLLSGCWKNEMHQQVEEIQLDSFIERLKVMNRESSLQLTHSFPISARLISQQTGERIDLRSQPSQLSDDKGYGLPGDQVVLLDAERVHNASIWYYVRFRVSGAEGWIPEEFIEIVDSSDIPSEIRALDIDRNLEMVEIDDARIYSPTDESEINRDSSPDSLTMFENAGLSVDQAEILQSMDKRVFVETPNGNRTFRVAIPQYIPREFYLDDFRYEERTVAMPSGFSYFYFSYVLLYRSNENKCFWLQVSTNEGGDMAAYQDMVEAISPDIGTFRLAYTEFDREIGGGMVHSGLTYNDHVAHMYTSPSWDDPSSCEWVGVSESVKIVESLTYPFP
jgi:hypothetical protein